eukprot:5785824-Pleurochrysis_carterae.AAC.2
MVDHHDEASCTIPQVQVKRSTPDGVEMMRSYPDVEQNPGVEDWLAQDKWSMSCVFDDLQRWAFADTTHTSTYRRQWESLRAWHTAYRLHSCGYDARC